MTVTTNPIVTGVPVAANVTNPRVSTNATVTGVPDVTDGEISNTVQTNPSASGKFELDTLLRSFDAPLQTSLVPSRTIGYPTPTYTRASTAYQTDFEGKQNLVPSGAARMQGARRVYNKAQAASAWTAQNTAVKTAGQTDPLGGTTAVQLDLPATNDGAFSASVTTVSGDTKLQPSIWLKADSSGTIQFLDITNGAFTVELNVMTSWRRYALDAAATANFTGVQMAIRRTGAGQLSKVFYAFPQIEDVTGQTNQNPSEYVSVGVLSAPYHGAGVDGVAYKSTLNGNTVVDNVVVEAQGAPITSAAAEAAGGVTAGVVDASGPLGYLSEGSRTNLALQSNAFTTTWSTAGTTTPTQNVTGPDGATSAWTLTDNDGAQFEYIYQEVLISAATHTLSLFVKKTTGAQASYPVIYALRSAGTDIALATIDTSNGVATVWTAYTGFTVVTSSASCVSFNADYWRVSLTHSGTAALWRSSLVPAGTANATQATGELDVAAQGSAVFYGAQLEAASFASTYIPTTTTAVTRAASVDQYASAGNISATATSLTMELTPSVALGSTTVFHWASYVDADNYTAVLSDGTNLIARKRIGGSNHDATIAWTRTAGTVAKVGARFDTTNGVDIFLSGTQGTADTTTTAIQIGAAFQVGADGNGANQDFCEHRFFKAYPTALSASRMQALTT